MNMKKLFLVITVLLATVAGQAQTAREVLDKCAASVSVKSGVTADFTMESAQYGNTSGSISVKGRMFYATTPVATMWFDGKTLWTYRSKNEEVNVSNPTDAQLQALNPYNFINMYKNGYSYTMTKTDKTFNVHLTANDANRRVKEMFITIDAKSYTPIEVKVLQGSKWSTFFINNFKKADLKDDAFRFNAREFPSAEVIDLR